MNCLVLLLLGIVPREDTLVEQADVTELNHFYDEGGQLVFRQLIFWDWDCCDDRHHVRAWRMQKEGRPVPWWDWRLGCYRTTWLDGEVMRDVRTRTYEETWTQYDPELIDREWVPRENRRELLRRPTEQAPVWP